MLYSHIIHICMQNHNGDTIKTSDTVLRKIYLSLYLKGLCVRGSWRPNRTATYWPQLLWLQQRFFPVLLGCSTSLGAGFLYRILSPTHLIPSWLNFLCTELYNSSTPTFFLWASQFRTHSICLRSKLQYPDIPQPDASVIYIGAFPILTAWPGRRSICNIDLYLTTLNVSIFWVFGMTRPGIEPPSSRPLATNLLIRPIIFYILSIMINYNKYRTLA